MTATVKTVWSPSWYSFNSALCIHRWLQKRELWKQFIYTNTTLWSGHVILSSSRQWSVSRGSWTTGYKVDEMKERFTKKKIRSLVNDPSAPLSTTILSTKDRHMGGYKRHFGVSSATHDNTKNMGYGGEFLHLLTFCTFTTPQCRKYSCM